MSTSQIQSPISGYELRPPPNNNNTPSTPSAVATTIAAAAAAITTTETSCCEFNNTPLILSSHHDNTTTPIIPIENNNALLITNENNESVIPHHENAAAVAAAPEISTHDDNLALDLSHDDATTSTSLPPPPPTTTTTNESMESYTSSHIFPDVPSVPLTTTTTHAAPPSSSTNDTLKQQQPPQEPPPPPPPPPSPPKDPSPSHQHQPPSSSSSSNNNNKRGRRKGDTFKHVTNVEIKTWCLDLYDSQLAIRPFCVARGLQSKKSTIGRHFKESGLQRLRIAKAGAAAAEEAMREYLAKRSDAKSPPETRSPTGVGVAEGDAAAIDDTVASAPADDPSLATKTNKRKTENVGRKPGETFRLCTADEIRRWCLDLFSSNLTLRPFCKRNRLEGRRSTISRHFKDSGLMALRNARGTRANAEVLMTRYLWKREAAMKSRMEKMHEANRRNRAVVVEKEGGKRGEGTEEEESGREPFRIYSNEEIKSWCVEYFSSGLPLRRFCASRPGLHSKRRTINKHFKESGLLALKKRNETATADDAAAAMDAYLRHRDEKKRSYIQKMHRGRDKMLALKDERKREEEAKSVIYAERETWLREEYRKMCAVFVGGEWTFERFKEFCERLETVPFKIVHEGYEVSLTRMDPVVELRKISDETTAGGERDDADEDGGDDDDGDDERGVDEGDGESSKMNADDKMVSEDDDTKDDDAIDDDDHVMQDDTTTSDEKQPLDKQPVPINWDRVFV